MKPKIDYVRILTLRFEEMYNFYTKVLGMEPRFKAANGPYEEFVTDGANLSIFSRGDMMAAMNLETSDNIHECQDKEIIIFRVDDVDATYDELKEKGVIFLTPPIDRLEWSIRTAHFRDPDGNIIEINQRLPNDTTNFV